MTVYTSGIDAREDEYLAANLPAVRVRLDRGQDVTGAAADLAAWFDEHAGPRPDLAVKVFERTLSEGGVYSIRYKPGGSPEAVLNRITYGRSHDILAGSLLEVLAYCAEHHWYSDGEDD